MKKSRIVAVFAGAVLLPALVLSVFGFRSIRADEAARQQELDHQIKVLLQLASDEAGADLAAWREQERQRLERFVLRGLAPSELAVYLNVHGERLFPPPLPPEPQPLEEAISRERPDLLPFFRRAVEIEHRDRNPARAAALYEELSGSVDHPASVARLLDRALRGSVRARRGEDAQRIGRRLIDEFSDIPGESGMPLGALARLHLLEIADETDRPLLIRSLLEAALDPASEWIVLRRLPDSGDEVRSRRRRAQARIEALTWAGSGGKETWIGVEKSLWAAFRIPVPEPELGVPGVAIAIVEVPAWPRDAVRQRILALADVAGIEVGWKVGDDWLFGPLERSDGEQAVVGTPLRVAAGMRDRASFDRAWRSQRLGWTGLALLLLVTMIAGFGFILRAVNREMEVARLKSDFISSVSHELRTPLTSIRMFSELSAGPAAADGPRRDEYLGLIRREAERLSTLVERLLDFSRLERGKRAFDFSPADLREVVERSVTSFRARHSGFRFDLDAGPGAVTVRVDAEAIEQAIHNLLDNAVKYAGEVRQVDVSVRLDGGTAVIAVRDHGMGIDPAERPALFDRFYRGRQGLDRGIPGTGLGLSIVKEIAGAHGGRVKIEDARDGGMVFSIEIPACRES